MSERLQEPRASLDHFIGRPVLEVEEGPGKSGHRTITLEGGIVIGNKDKNRTLPDDLKGKTLCMVILGEFDTRLQFGTTSENGVIGETWVELSPTQYTIAGLEGQTREFFPQVPEEFEAALPPDPSPERIVNGPQEAVGGAEEASNGEG